MSSCEPGGPDCPWHGAATWEGHAPHSRCTGSECLGHLGCVFKKILKAAALVRGKQDFIKSCLARGSGRGPVSQSGHSLRFLTPLSVEWSWQPCWQILTLHREGGEKGIFRAKVSPSLVFCSGRKEIHWCVRLHFVSAT